MIRPFGYEPERGELLNTNRKTIRIIAMTDLQNSEVPRTVLVTGGAGFIGSALVRYLLAKTTAKVINFDKMTYAANPLTLDTLVRIRQHQHIQADICDEKAMADIIAEIAPDIVIHLAAESHVDRSIDGPADFVRTNILGTYTLLEIVTRYRRERAAHNLKDVRFINVSTDEVYGSLGPNNQFSEESAYNPNSHTPLPKQRQIISRVHGAPLMDLKPS